MDDRFALMMIGLSGTWILGGFCMMVAAAFVQNYAGKLFGRGMMLFCAGLFGFIFFLSEWIG